MKHLRDLFSSEELLTVLEAARVALCDADVFDQICDDMDVSDACMLELRERLTSALADDRDALDCYVLVSKQTYGEYWSNDLGWVPLDSSTRFLGKMRDDGAFEDHNGNELDAPMGGFWRSYQSCTTITQA